MTPLLLAAVPVVLPFACFLLLGVVWPLRHTGRPAALLSSLVAVVSFLAALFAWEGAPGAGEPALTLTQAWLVHEGVPLAEVGLRLDAVSASMLVVVTFVAACVQVYSLGYMADEPRPALGRYYAWHSLFVVAMSGLVLAPNLLQLLAAWELVGLCSYLLIGYYWTRPSAGKAAVKAVWVTRFADIGLMSGVVLLYAQTGSFDWSAEASPWVAALLFCGVMGKSAQVPLHVWLPDAMEGPTPVSALLHAATMVAAGVYLVVRAWPIFAAAPDVLLVMAWVGGVTAVVAAVTATVQTDIKKVLAYSTCSQLGYMVAGLGSGEMLGGYFHLTTHAFFKALLFLAAGSIIHAVHSNELKDMGGLWSRTRFTGALFILGSLALAGLPGLAGFFSKDLILEELFHAGLYGPLALCLVAAALTPFYMARVVCMAFFGRPSPGAEHAHESPSVMLAPMMLLAVPAVVAGYGGYTFALSLGLDYHFALTPVGIAATALGLGGIAVGVARYGFGRLEGIDLPGVARFVRSGPMDAAWTAGWRSVFLPVAGVVGWVDRYVVDGLVNLFGWGALVLGDGLRGLQTGRVRDYLYAVAVGAVVLAAWGVVGGAS